MPSSDAFRPRLPIDPFTSLETLPPWHVPQDLPHSPPQVILILGEPHKNDFFPLLTSPRLARSLLLIATHTQPPIPVLEQNTPGPNVCILRLSAPLAVHDNGALRLVKLFERAHRVAGRWRASMSLPQHRFVQLAECKETGEFTVAEPFLSFGGTPKTLPPTSFQPPRKFSFRLSSHSLLSSPNGTPFASTTSLPSPKKLRRTSVAAQPSPYSLSPPAQQDGLRAFDAILNFLPGGGVPDKALLKHAILVTTLSAQYLAVPEKNVTREDDEKSPNARFSAPGVSSSYSFSSSIPSSRTSTTSQSASITTTPATSPSPSPPLIPSEESSNYLTKRKGTVKASFVKRFSSLLRPSSSSGGVPYANGVGVRGKAGGWDGYYANAKPHGTEVSLKPKNSHLIHILPLDWVDWEEEELKEEQIRYSHQDKGKGKARLLPSGPRYQGGDVNYHHGSHPSGNLHHHHHRDVNGKRQPPASSRTSKKPKLAQGIEQFLLTFAYPLGSLGLGPGNGGSSGGSPHPPRSSMSAHGHGDAKPKLTGLAAAAQHVQMRAVPYLLAPGVFARALHGARVELGSEYPGRNFKDGGGGGRSDSSHSEGTPRLLVIGEIILLGALDFDAEEAYGRNPGVGCENDAYGRRYSAGQEDRGNARAVGAGRAWVGLGDVVCSSKASRNEERGREERHRDHDYVNREERIRETEMRLEGSSRNAAVPRFQQSHSQQAWQLPTPPDSSSSGESVRVEDAYYPRGSPDRDRYYDRQPPRRGYDYGDYRHASSREVQDERGRAYEQARTWRGEARDDRDARYHDEKYRGDPSQNSRYTQPPSRTLTSHSNPPPPPQPTRLDGRYPPPHIRSHDYDFERNRRRSGEAPLPPPSTSQRAETERRTQMTAPAPPPAKVASRPRHEYEYERVAAGYMYSPAKTGSNAGPAEAYRRRHRDEEDRRVRDGRDGGGGDGGFGYAVRRFSVGFWKGR